MKKMGWALGGLAALVSSHQAMAQSATVEEIVVTAQRREQSLQDTPVAVSAFSTETLERAHVETTTALISLVPNMSGGQVTGAGSANNYTLRGLYNADTAATVDNPVGTYVDGVFMARMNANNFALFDVQRIEVLRGPQGTLFGRNTTGGAINVILKRPADKFGGQVEAEGGSENHYMFRAGVDAPLSDKVATRTSAFKLADDGWLKNTTTGKHNNGHTAWGLREAVTASFSDNVKWYGTADYVSDKNANVPATKDAYGGFFTTTGLQALTGIVYGRKATIPGNFIGNKTWGLASTFNIDTGLGDLEILTAFRRVDSKFNVDYFEGPSRFGGFDSVQDSNHKEFQQEIKLTGATMNDQLNYTVGAFYLKEKNVTDAAAVFNLGAAFLFTAPDATYYNDTDSLAGYAQFDYKFTQQFVATAGVRVTHDKKTLHWVNNGNPRATFVISDAYLTANGIPLQQTITEATPRFALEYHATEDFMAFVSATRGFRSGGWGVRGSNFATLNNFQPEKVWSYEAGFRAETWEKRLRLNTTFFYGDNTALQLPTASTAAGGAPSFPTGNFSDLHSYGVEVEAVLVPTDGLTLTATIGYDKTKYANLTAAVITQQNACRASITAGLAARPNCAAGIITATGEIAKPARAPKFTGALGASYDIVASDAFTLTPSALWRHTSGFNTNAAQLAQAEQAPYDLISATLTAALTQKGVSFSAGCENCNNSHYLLSFISGHYWYNHPRTWFAKASVKF